MSQTRGISAQLLGLRVLSRNHHTHPDIPRTFSKIHQVSVQGWNNLRSPMSCRFTPRHLRNACATLPERSRGMREYLNVVPATCTLVYAPGSERRAASRCRFVAAHPLPQSLPNAMSPVFHKADRRYENPTRARAILPSCTPEYLIQLVLHRSRLPAK